MSIEVIALDHFSATKKTETETTPKAQKFNAVFHLFLYYDRKQDAATAIAHIKRISEFLKQRNIMYTTLSTIWEKKYGCAEHYICATKLYLMLIL